MNIFQLESELIKVNPEILFYIGDFPFTNTMTTGILTLLIMIALTIFTMLNFRVKNPSKFQLAVEMIYMAMVTFVAQITGNERIAWRIMPIIGTLFLFIGISDVITLVVPLLGSITFNEATMFRTYTSDFNTTFSIAIGMIIAVQVFSIQKNSIIGYISKFIKIADIVNGFRKSLLDGFLGIVNAFVGLLDLISEFAKIASLSLRLFGNMFAGEILILVMMGLFAVLLPIPMIFLGLLAGVLQALVFGALVSSYFGSALAEE